NVSNMMGATHPDKMESVGRGQLGHRAGELYKQITALAPAHRATCANHEVSCLDPESGSHGLDRGWRHRRELVVQDRLLIYIDFLVGNSEYLAEGVADGSRGCDVAVRLGAKDLQVLRILVVAELHLKLMDVGQHLRR